MRARQVNDEVLYAEDSLVVLQRSNIEELKRRAESNPRKRIRVCTHQGVEDGVHEMFIVHAKGAYVRPHKHLGKPESLFVLEGDATVIVFADDGAIQDVVALGEYATASPFYYRMHLPQYHTLLITSQHFVFHETTSGPFRRSDTVFAPWAPEEADAEAVRGFLRRVQYEAARVRASTAGAS